MAEGVDARRDRTGPARRVLVDALGVGAATGAYALSFGAIARSTGLSLGQTCALSLLLFSGASQFALVGVLGAGGGAVSAAATAVLLGSRNALYGLRLASVLSLSRGRRLVAAQLVIDESTAMSLARTDPALGRLAFWSTGISVFLLWNLGTLVGALGAQALPSPKALGLDAAVPAAFIALLAPRLHGGRPWLVALLAGVVAVALIPLTPAGVPVLGAAAVAAMVALPRSSS